MSPKDIIKFKKVTEGLQDEATSLKSIDVTKEAPKAKASLNRMTKSVIKDTD
ncbi:hypothetical protein BGX27_005562, partial [Mortierella sp. AM989]